MKPVGGNQEGRRGVSKACSGLRWVAFCQLSLLGLETTPFMSASYFGL